MELILSTINRNQNKEIPTTIFYTYGNGSNDGSVYANKTFHVAYYILKHDFKNKVKTIIGILYNKADKDAIGEGPTNPDNKLYFNCIMPLTEMFSIPYLLKNVIYRERYDKYQMKKVMTEDNTTKSIISYADKILMSKVNSHGNK